MRILVATNNPAKRKRIQELLAEYQIDFLCPADLSIPAIEGGKRYC
ncbi:MAG TPA: hypothetical protein VFQ60_01460 [Patescibacteria group bacterium]|nr:hypothetical protein [Patescibacteria group bacterium]